jgi:hypothetical protein
MIYINAKPLIVWNDFYFIQTRGGLSKYQKLAEMTQNRFNAWDTTSCSSWGGTSNQQVEEIADNENFAVALGFLKPLHDERELTVVRFECRMAATCKIQQH